MRFKGRCSVSINVEDAVRETDIPQFTLQPIVENAFEHGLQAKRGMWNISISAKSQHKGILLVIQDDGVGMSPDLLSRQRHHLFQRNIVKNTAESHIGLKNVDTRLKLHFGNQYGLKLFSREGVGTSIVLILPDSQKGGNYDI